VQRAHEQGGGPIGRQYDGIDALKDAVNRRALAARGEDPSFAPGEVEEQRRACGATSPYARGAKCQVVGDHKTGGDGRVIHTWEDPSDSSNWAAWYGVEVTPHVVK